MNFKKFFRNNKKLAFTLAEVVIVMGILGIMMVAFAPVVTKRTETSGVSKGYWGIATGHEGIYFGSVSDNKTVIIGDNGIRDGEIFSPKLLLVSDYITSDSTKMTPQIEFATKANNTDNAVTYVGNLIMTKGVSGSDNDQGSVILGGKQNSNSHVTLANLKNITAVGANACANVTGKNSVCIGANANTTTSTPNTIIIGNSDVSYLASNIYFGSNPLDSFITQTPSDIRLKNVGKEFKGGIDELNKLKIYNFTYKRDADKTPRVGVMAQDLQKVFPNAVAKNADGYYYIRKEDIFYSAINAIKEAFAKITTYDATIKALEARNKQLEQQNIELQKALIDLSKRVDKLDHKKTDLKFTKIDEIKIEIPEVTPETQTKEVKEESNDYNPFDGNETLEEWQ